MTDKPTATELEAELQNFTGSQTFYRHALLRSCVYTEGVQHLAERAQAHWLVDAIVSHQLTPSVAAEAFQVWTLQQLQADIVTGAAGAWVLSCEDGNGKAVAAQEIGWSTFPLQRIQLWFVDCTLLLPSEY